MLEWFSIKVLVNSEIFKLLLNLSLLHLRAQITCYELKGDLSPVILKEIFYNSLKIFKVLIKSTEHLCTYVVRGSSINNNDNNNNNNNNNNIIIIIYCRI